MDRAGASVCGRLAFDTPSSATVESTCHPWLADPCGGQRPSVLPYRGPLGGRGQSLRTQNQEFVASTLVLAFDALTPVEEIGSLAKLEDQFQAAVSVEDASPSGVQINLPRKRIEVTVLPGRWDITYIGDKVTPAAATDIAQAAHILASYFTETRCRGVGYNFATIFTSPGSRPAVEVISRRFLAAQAISRRLQRPVLGGAVSLYFDLPSEGQTWPHLVQLRLEPRLGDQSTARIWALGTLQDETPDRLPDQGTLVSSFLRAHETFSEVLRRL